MDFEELAAHAPQEGERYEITEATFAGIKDQGQLQRIKSFACTPDGSLTEEMRNHIQRMIWDHTLALFARCQGAWGASPVALASAIVQAQAVTGAVIFEMSSPVWTKPDGTEDPIDPLERVTVLGDFAKALSEDYGRWMIRHHALKSGQAGRA